MISSCSVESDWSDEELEELEKMFGNIQHKSSMAVATENLGPESSNLASGDAATSADSESLSKWRQLSRRIAMLKLQQQQKRTSRESFVSTSSLTNSSGKKYYPKGHITSEASEINHVFLHLFRNK